MEILFLLFLLGLLPSYMHGGFMTNIFGRRTRTAESKPQPPLKYADTQPSVEIRLSPPRHPLPEVSGKLEVLDLTRKRNEERLTAKLLRVYDDEVKRSRRLITSLIRDAFQNLDDPPVIPSSFFQYPPDPRYRPGRIFVSVHVPKPIDGLVTKRIESIEERNTKNEISEFHAIIDDLREVTHYTLQQLNETLVNIMRPVIQTRGSAYSVSLLQEAENRCLQLEVEFGQDLVNCTHSKIDINSTHQHTITAFADEHLYPTAESLVKDMLERRELDEELFRSRALTLMAKLAQEQSKIINSLLHASVASISVQYSDVIRAINMTHDQLTDYKTLHPRRGPRKDVPDPTDKTQLP
jgi:hypothetical protein